MRGLAFRPELLRKKLELDLNFSHRELSNSYNVSMKRAMKLI